MTETFLDYPTAWRLVKLTKADEHHERCSYRVSEGGVLCDCAVVAGIRIARSDNEAEVCAQAQRAEAAEAEVTRLREVLAYIESRLELCLGWQR